MKCSDRVVYEFEADVEDVIYEETADDSQLLRINMTQRVELVLRVKPEIKLIQKINGK